MQPARLLDRLEDVGPQAAYVDQAETAGAAAGRRPRPAGSGRLRRGGGSTAGAAARPAARGRLGAAGRGRWLGGGRARQARPAAGPSPALARGAGGSGAARRLGRRAAGAATGLAAGGGRRRVAADVRPLLEPVEPGQSRPRWCGRRRAAAPGRRSARAAAAVRWRPASRSGPAATRSAARLSSARPNRAAWATSRSPWSCGDVDQPGRRGVGHGGDDDAGRAAGAAGPR